jgi:Rod binding domain-containing protein
MHIGTIGPHTAIELPQAASERLAQPRTAERPRNGESATAGSAAASGSEAAKAIEDSTGPPRARHTAGHKKDNSAELTHAAQEFESLLLAQILRSVREAGSGGWLGSGESQQMSSTMELAETQLASAMAQSGALGITKLLAGNLRADSDAAGAQQPPGTQAVRLDRNAR